MQELNAWFEDYSSMIYADLSLAQELYERSCSNKAYLALSLYHAQQAVEKAIKLYLVATDTVSIKELKDYRHDPLPRIAIQVIRQERNRINQAKRRNKITMQIIKLTKFLDKLEEIFEFLKNRELLYKKFVEDPTWKKEAGKEFFKLKQDITKLYQNIPILQTGQTFLDLFLDKFANGNYSITWASHLNKEIIDSQFETLDLQSYIEHLIEKAVDLLTETIKLYSKQPVKIDTNQLKTKLKQDLQNPKTLYNNITGDKINNLITPFIPLLSENETAKLLYIFPFATYGRYIEPHSQTTTLRKIAQKKQEIQELIILTKGYVNTLYAASKFYHMLKTL